MLQYYFSLPLFRLNSGAFSYIVLRLTYIRGLILELSRSFSIGCSVFLPLLPRVGLQCVVVVIHRHTNVLVICIRNYPKVTIE